MSPRTSPRNPRDPTLFLVLGLVLVVAAILVPRWLTGGPDEADLVPVDNVQPTVTPSLITSPSSLPTPTASATPDPEPKPRRKPKQAGPPKLDIAEQGKKECVPADEDTDITVVSYNIKSGHLAGSLSRIAETLRASDAGVVLLQEVDQLRYASGRVDMPAVFGAQLDLPYAFGKNVPHSGGGGYGTVILSRYPLVAVENTFLPQPPGTQRRGLLHAVIDVDGTEVSIYNTHLQNADPSARMLQVAAINRVIADDARPRILGGDLNTPPGSPPINVLATRWIDTWSQVGVGAGHTAPAGNPGARIDYLLYGGEGIAPLASDVLPVRLSDHLAVRASYRLAGEGERICFQKLR